MNYFVSAKTTAFYCCFCVVCKIIFGIARQELKGIQRKYHLKPFEIGILVFRISEKSFFKDVFSENGNF
jgi:hypothetical protein